MSSDDDDFERYVAGYSEIETVAEEQVQPVPHTIRKYQKKIEDNNNTSIFDKDYSSPIINGVGSDCGVQGNVHDKFFRDEGRCVQVISGRGRGGRNIFHRPGTLNETNDHDEVTRQIRKVAPVGYGNEITEITVQAHRKSKQLQQQSAETKPSLSNSNSPAKLPVKTSDDLREDSEVRSKSSFNSKGTESQVFEAASRISTPNSRCSDVGSSEYFTSHDQVVSDGSQVAENVDVNQNVEENGTESTVQVTNKLHEIPCDEHIPAPRVEGIRPIPMSEMLRRSREQHRQRQLERKVIRTIEVSLQNSDNGVRTMEHQILHRDRIKDQKQEESPSSRSSNSSTCSFSARDDVLSWRQRRNSPPRFSWGQNFRKNRMLNIDSSVDFPPLK